MSVRRTLHRHFVPSHHNSYRPHLLRKEWLLFFVAVIFASEGVFVSGLFIQQGNTQMTVAAVAAAPAPSTVTNSIGRTVLQMLTDSQPVVPWALGTVLVTLLLAIFLAFFLHIQVQQPEMLFSGAMVAMLALSLILTNAQILGMM